jgi:hypothetical protein
LTWIKACPVDPELALLTLILINASRVRQGLLAKRSMEPRMPLARYFSFVGGVLLALLLILDACLPELPVAAKATVYLPVIRIYSDRKWPERIVYDTNLPTIVPKSMASTEDIIETSKTIADVSTGARERESFAMLPLSTDRLQASNTKIQEPKPQHRRKIARKRPPAPMVAMARHLQFGQFGWFARNFW